MAFGPVNIGGKNKAADISYDNSKSGIAAENVQDALDTGFDIVLPTLTVTVDSGSEITLTDGEETITGTAGTDGAFTTRLLSLGTWTATATLNGQTTTGNIDITALGNSYSLMLAYFSATLTVTAVAGAVVTATSADATYTATAGSNGKAIFPIKRAGSYTVRATKDNIPSNSATVSVTSDGGSYTATVKFITLTVTVDSGSTITVTDGTHTYTKTGTGSDTWYLPNTGTWTVSAVLGDFDTSETVSITAYQAYTVELLYFSEILEENTPAQIQKAAQLGIAPDLWSVGDTHTVTLNGIVTVSEDSLSFSNETYCAFIIGFNHNSDIEGDNTIHFQFGKEVDGTDIAFENNYHGNTGKTNGFIMSTSSADYWETSYMRNTICPSFLNVLPEEWRTIIAACTKYTGTYLSFGTGTRNVTPTSDRIWLLAEYEVLGSKKEADTKEQNFQAQYSYYANGNSTVKIGHNGTTDTNSQLSGGVNWWLRSASLDEGYFCCINYNGNGSTSSERSSRGFAPGFMVA